MSWRLRSSLLVVGVLSLSALADGRNAKVAPDMPSADDSTINVIVRYKMAPTVLDLTRAAFSGAKPRGVFTNAKSVAYTLPSSAVDAMATDPLVAYVSPDRSLRGTLNYAVPAVGADIALSLGWSGAGVGVAVIDSGIDTEGDLSSKLSGGRHESFTASPSSTLAIRSPSPGLRTNSATGPTWQAS